MRFEWIKNYFTLSITLSVAAFLSILTVTECKLKIYRLDNLKLEKVYIIDGRPIFADRADLSGLTSDGERLFTVSDRDGKHDIYLINLDDENNSAKLSIYKSFPQQWLQEYREKYHTKGKMDFEGISYCANDSFYIVDERVRNLLHLKDNIAQEIELNFADFHKKPHNMNPFSGVNNAGLEAVAVDCKRNLVYLFNERQFRMGYTYSLSENRIINQFDFPTDPTLPFHVGKWQVYPDFSGAFFYEDFLYVLERNARQIVKYDPNNFQVLQRWQLPSIVDELYDTKQPFGIAEGLAIHKGYFYVILDNNNSPRTGTTNDLSSSLLKFKP